MLWPRVRGAAEHHAIAIDGDVLDHHHGVRAGRHGRAGHDLHALAGAHGAVEAAARADFADAAQRRARPRVVGAHGEAVANGAIEGRIVAIRLHRLGQHAPAGARKLDCFRGREEGAERERWQ